MAHVAHPSFQGTIVSPPPFDPSLEAQLIMKALKESDEDSIARVLAYRTNAERQQIKQNYQLLFSKNLEEDVHSRLLGNFRHTILGLLDSLNVFYAKELFRAMEGAGTDEASLTEILCTLSSKQLTDVQAIYKQKFNRDLESDIASETSGDFKRLLLKLCGGLRDEVKEVDVQQAKKDAQDLYAAGEKKFGTDEKVFIDIMCTRSDKQIRETAEQYKQISKHTLEQAIKSEMSGDLRRGLIAILHSTFSLQTYLAERLHESMKGLGTNDKTLVRIVVSRCEIDMVQILNSFHRHYGKELSEWITGETSGSYRTLLLSLIGANITKHN